MKILFYESSTVEFKVCLLIWNDELWSTPHFFALNEKKIKPKTVWRLLLSENIVYITVLNEVVERAQPEGRTRTPLVAYAVWYQ